METNVFQADMDFFLENRNQIDIIKECTKEVNRIDVIYCFEAGGKKEEKEGFIMRAINTIKSIIETAFQMIKKALGTIDNKIRYGLLSKKKKEEFNKFQEYVKNNPNVKNKQIKVKDWNRINREYDNVEKKLVAMMNDDSVDANGYNAKSLDLFNNLAALTNTATASISVDMAMVLARKSPEMAKKVELSLQHSQAALQNIQNTLGEKEVMKLQNKVHKLTKETMAQKIMAKFYVRKEESISDCLHEMYDSFGKLMGTGTKTEQIKAGIEHRDLIRNGAKKWVTNKDVRKGINQAWTLKNKIGEELNTPGTLANTAKEFINPSTH
jgi:hypothetical protein